MSTCTYDDSLGKLMGENGEEAIIVEMDGDTEAYPLGNITDYDQYIDVKPPERAEIKSEINYKQIDLETESSTTRKRRREYRICSDSEKEHFFELIYEKGLRVYEAARKLGMPVRTAQGRVEQDQKDHQDILQRKPATGILV